MKEYVANLLQNDQLIYTAERAHESELCPAVAFLQEETDSKIILNTDVAAENGSQQIIVDNPETDVLVLRLHH